MIVLAVTLLLTTAASSLSPNAVYNHHLSTLSNKLLDPKRLKSRNSRIEVHPNLSNIQDDLDRVGTMKGSPRSPDHFELESTSTKSRSRRGSYGHDEPACDQSNAQQPTPYEHQFDGSGGLTIQWVGNHSAVADIQGMMMTVVSADPSSPPSSTNLWISTDDGMTWVQCSDMDNEALEAATFSEIPMDDSSGHYLAYALPLPTDGVASHLWVSDQSGRSWRKMLATHNHGSPCPYFETILPSPHQAGSFLASDSNNAAWYCSGVEGAIRNNNDIKCSKKAMDVVDMDFVKTGPDKGALLLVHRNDSSDVQSFTKWTQKGKHIFKGDVAGASGGGIGDMQQWNQFIFLTDLPDYSSNASFEKSLFVSSDYGSTFSQAVFPFLGRNNHFEVIDASEDFALVAVDHNKTRVEGDVHVHIEVGEEDHTAIAFRALFSKVIPPEMVRAEIVTNPENPTGCDESGGVTADLGGKYLLLERGQCKFSEKAWAAANAGALGLVVVNLVDDHHLYMQAPSGTKHPRIPVVIISSSEGERLKNQINTGQNPQVFFTEDNAEERVLYRQSILYHSDASGLNYAVSLKDVLYAPEPDANWNTYTDVYKVASMHGTYIANCKDGFQTASVITFNKGASWYKMSAPEDRRKNCGDGPCNMNLVLESDHLLANVPMPVSTEQAIGLIIANAIDPGGSALDHGEVYTVVSRDGGNTWHQIEDPDDESFTHYGPHDFRILDHGAVIVQVPWGVRTTSIDYALDEAKHGEVSEFNFLQGDSEDVVIMGLVAEPGGSSTAAFIYYFDMNAEQWHGVQINFDQVLERSCEIDSDFESFIPPTLNVDNDCILGETQSYYRRKACSLCEIEHEYVITPIRTTKCICSHEDFMCVPGFHRPNNIDPVDMMCVTDADAMLPPCSDGDTLLMPVMTQIPGDKCENPAPFYSPVSVPCEPGGESVAEEVLAGFGYLVGFGVLSVLLIAFVFTFSKGARDAAIGIFGTDGKIGKFLARFACFRAQEKYVYSVLSEETTSGLISAESAGLYDEDEENTDDDGDDLLFDLDETQLEGANEGNGLPIYNN